MKRLECKVGWLETTWPTAVPAVATLQNSPLPPQWVEAWLAQRLLLGLLGPPVEGQVGGDEVVGRESREAAVAQRAHTQTRLLVSGCGEWVAREGTRPAQATILASCLQSPRSLLG